MSESTEAPDESSITESDDSSSVGTPTIRQLPLVAQQSQQAIFQPSQRATPLKKSARTYDPASAQELAFVLNFLQVFLRGLPCVLDVDVAACGPDRQLVVCTSCSGSGGTQWIVEAAQSALVSVCEDSHSVYLLGYCNQPFQALDAKNVMGTLCVVPQSASDNVCWGAMMHGRCRKATCGWQHPEIFDRMRLTLTFT